MFFFWKRGCARNSNLTSCVAEFRLSVAMGAKFCPSSRAQKSPIIRSTPMSTRTTLCKPLAHFLFRSFLQTPRQCSPITNSSRSTSFKSNPSSISGGINPPLVPSLSVWISTPIFHSVWIGHGANLTLYLSIDRQSTRSSPSSFDGFSVSMNANRT